MKSRLTTITLFVPILLWLAAVAHAAGTVEARLDRTRVRLGETVQLTVQAQGRLSGDLDTSPLDKDFQVLGTSSGSSINIVNGSMSSSKTWQITLEPKRQGTLTIPPLAVGGQHTEPLSLIVSASPAPQATSGADIFIETAVVPPNPYEQQMVLYQVRLFHAVQLASGSLTAPQPRDTLVQKVGKDRTYTATVNGRSYQVIERTYALFPQQAGKLTIAPPVFTGKVVEATNNGNLFGSFFGHDPFFGHGMGMLTTTRSARITGRMDTLTVRPHPAGIRAAAWLPADSVQLAQKWLPAQTTVRVGDAVTRTVTVTAVGQNGAALPELAPSGVKGFEVYPDKAKVQSATQNGTICGTSRQKVAFIPVRPGTFTLPPVHLAWWDVKAGKPREVSLPARAITVLPGNNQFAATAPAPVPPLPKSAQVAPPAGPAKKVPVPVARPVATRPWFWPLVAVGLGAGWLLTLLVLAFNRRRRIKKVTPPSPSQMSPPPAPSAADPRRELLAACESGDASRARRSLLKWAARLWPDQPPKGLSELADRVDDAEAAQAIAELDRYLYSAQEGQWDGGKLKALLKRVPGKAGRKSGKKPGLPPLYP